MGLLLKITLRIPDEELTLQGPIEAEQRTYTEAHDIERP